MNAVQTLCDIHHVISTHGYDPALRALLATDEIFFGSFMNSDMEISTEGLMDKIKSTIKNMSDLRKAYPVLQSLEENIEAVQSVDKDRLKDPFSGGFSAKDVHDAIVFLHSVGETVFELAKELTNQTSKFKSEGDVAKYMDDVLKRAPSHLKFTKDRVRVSAKFQTKKFSQDKSGWNDEGQLKKVLEDGEALFKYTQQQLYYILPLLDEASGEAKAAQNNVDDDKAAELYREVDTYNMAYMYGKSVLDTIDALPSQISSCLQANLIKTR